MARPQKRGAVRKADSKIVAIWLPEELAAALDLAVRSEDSDRSKIIRKALRRHLAPQA